ncbi:hypothetical protein N7456_013364 [Penicillium angulare]|uniref:Uncharacterized protein n=1 Tax=Penicillium angulare TaxID=116970 RepID=A0A9W9EG25_9EURO|nr:hypothetical protein N7456_013364 [Penicillium angulare]
MSRALKGLLDGGIPVMEYGEQIAARYGNADAPMQVEWVIPDNEIHRASQILLAHGLPISKTDPWPHFGVWEKKPFRHELSSELGICIYLIPMRIVKLGLEDTIEVFSWCSDELKIRSPIPGRYMMSLIRLLRLMKLDSSSRHRPEKDLKDFVSFAIFGKRDKGIIPAIQYSEYERGAREMRKKIIADIVVDGWDFGQVDAAELELVRNVIWDPLAVRRLFDVSQKVVDL